MGDIKFEPYSIGEDRLYLVKALLRTKTKIGVGVPGYYYRNRPGSAIHSTNTLKKQVDSISWKRDALVLFDRAAFTVGCVARRRMFLSLLEGCAYGMISLLKHDRNKAWKYWFDIIDDVPVRLAPSVWICFIVGVLRLTHCKSIAYVFCVLPFWLKSRGIHR